MMDFALTADQVTLRDSVRDYLAGTHGAAVVRGLAARGGRDAAIWSGLVEMGLTALLVPEAEGGLGLGLVEGVLVAIELGRANVSEPVVDTALVAAPWLLAMDRVEPLGAIARGSLRIALAHPVNPWIADLDDANAVIRGGGFMPGPAIPGAPVESIDPLRRLFAATEIDEIDDFPLLDLAALMTAAQLVGGAERMLDLATDYAKIRTQFGQPIGGFQAIKHQLANVAVALEFVRPVLLRAAYAAQHRHARAPLHISHAKLAAADAATLAAETAIQVHGAMGYTYEVDLHFWMKRSWALAGAWGDRAFHLQRIEDAVIGGAIVLGPDMSFAEDLQYA